MKRTLRAAPAVACLLGFYGIAVGGVALLAFVAVRVVLDAGPGLAAAVTVLLLGLAVLVATVISTTLRKPLPEPVGLLLEQVNHPDLWAEVVELAARVGTKAPDEIRLVPEPAVTLTEDVGRLGLVSGTRRLGLGVPLMMTLTRSEMHAVLAHELAHYRGGFLGLSAIAYRGQLTLGELAARERSSSPMGVLIGACARGYLHVSKAVNRHQEIEADEVSALIAGSGPAIAALRQVPAVELLWYRYVTDYAFAAPGLRPIRLFEGFGQLWSEPRIQAGLAAVRDEPVVREASPYDSHPATEERLDRLLEQKVDVPVDDTLAKRMIKRSGWHAIELENSMFRHSELRPASWDEIADGAGRRQIFARAGQVDERLDLLVSDLTPGRARVLTADVLADDASAADVRSTAVEMVSAVIEAALLERGAASVVPSWTTSWRLVDETGKSLDVAATVAGAYRDDELRAALLEFVRSEGLADFRAHPLGSTSTTPVQLLGLMSGRRKGASLVVAVTDGGVLLSPTASVAGESGGTTQQVLETASARGLSALVATPGARLVRWGDILEARSTSRDAALTLRLVSGEKVNLTTARGRIVGEPRPALAQYLGPRYHGSPVG